MIFDFELKSRRSGSMISAINVLVVESSRWLRTGSSASRSRRARTNECADKRRISACHAQYSVKWFPLALTFPLFRAPRDGPRAFRVHRSLHAADQRNKSRLGCTRSRLNMYSSRRFERYLARNTSGYATREMNPLELSATDTAGGGATGRGVLIGRPKIEPEI